MRNAPVTHQHLLTLMVRLPSDFEPYGERIRDGGADCSCGCLWFAKLAGKLGYDWGVCANPASPRNGLLTFEHQGCPHFEEDAALRDEVEQLRAESLKDPRTQELQRKIDECRVKRGDVPEGA